MLAPVPLEELLAVLVTLPFLSSFLSAGAGDDDVLSLDMDFLNMLNEGMTGDALLTQVDRGVEEDLRSSRDEGRGRGSV